MKKLILLPIILFTLIASSQITTRCQVCPPTLRGVPDGYVLTDSAGFARWQAAGGGGAGSFWKTTGNAGTDPSVNFIGTTDTNVFNIRVGNFPSGVIDGINVNTAFGYGSLSSVTPIQDYASHGGENTSYGMGSLFTCDSCNGNTAIGAYSMLSLTNGRRNVGVGGGTLYNCTTGRSNTAVGSNSLVDNIDGSFNTAVGDSCLTFLQHGNYNTALGDSSLYTLTYGNYNIAIGHDASTTTDSASSSIALGAHVRAASNQFALTDSITNLKWRLNGQTNGYVLTTNGTTANWQSFVGTPIKDSISATGATVSPAINTTHVITSAGAITSATLSFPTGITGDWIIVIFNKAVATLTNSGTGAGLVGLVAPLLGTSKIYVNIGGNWY